MDIWFLLFICTKQCHWVAWFQHDSKQYEHNDWLKSKKLNLKHTYSLIYHQVQHNQSNTPQCQARPLTFIRAEWDPCSHHRTSNYTLCIDSVGPLPVIRLRRIPITTKQICPRLDRSTSAATSLLGIRKATQKLVLLMLWSTVPQWLFHIPPIQCITSQI